jgi:hypothetical protein
MSHLDENRTTPIGMLRFAVVFYAASIATRKALARDVIAPVPVNYLMGHALELGLKAYLLHHGLTPNQIKRELGHDLLKCLAHAEKLGLLDELALHATILL